MSNALTKAQILAGKNQIYMEHVPELGGEVALRPLSMAEHAEIEAEKTKGTKLHGSPDINDLTDMSGLEISIDLEKLTRAEFRANCMAVAYSLSASGEEFSVEEVMNIRPPKVINRLAEVVFEISGTPQKQKAKAKVDEKIKSFRSK